jgi:hypothetical protein
MARPITAAVSYRLRNCCKERLDSISSHNWSAFRHILIYATKILPLFATAKSTYKILEISHNCGYSASPDALRRKKESDLLRAGVRSSI